MLEALVASILNRVLGNYVSNLNYDQLKIAVWNGEVNLHNLQLRKDALDKLKLPIDVVEGHLGELTLSIPWSNLKTKPVKVHIKNVYVLAVPKTDATVNLKEEEERAQQQKQQRLQKAELLDASKSDLKAMENGKNNNNGGGGFVSQLTTKVIDNLQLSLENIHLRYEDTVSCPGHPFAAGITLKELSAISTDNDWQAAFIGNLADTIHKLAKLDSLSIYWNTSASSLAGLPHDKSSKIYTEFISATGNDPLGHQYIVKPVSGTGKIKVNKTYGKDKANFDVTLLFDELGFCLDDEQYRDALLLVDLFHSNLKKQDHLKLRPPPGTTPKTDPRAYLKYAGEAVLSKIHEHNHKWTWDHFRARRDQRLAYITCYLAQKRNTSTPQQKKQLEQLEWDLTFEDIRFYRSIAKNQLRKENVITTKQKSTKKGWFNSLWNRQDNSPSSSSSGDNLMDDSQDSVVLTEEQKKELCDVIDYDGHKDDIENALDMPKDTMKFVLSTKLNRGSFELMRNSHTTKQHISSIVFDTVGIDVIKYIGSMKVAAQLGDLQLYDGTSKDTFYPQLMGVKKDTGDEGMSIFGSNNGGQQTRSGKDYQPFLAIEYQQKPLDKKADKYIKLAMRHLEIIYNPSTIHAILSFFKSPNAQSESFDALIEVAGDTLEGFRRQTRAGLEYALENHSTLDLDVDMDAPIIIIPESCFVENSPTTIIFAGHIRIDSDLANQALAQEFKTNNNKEYSAEDLKQLEDLMYDKFNVGFTQIKLLTGCNVRNAIEQLDMDASKTDGDSHILRRVDIQLLVERCIVPGASQFPKIKVNGQAPLVQVNLSTQKYKTFMTAVDLVLSSIKDDAATDSMDETQQRDSSNQQQSLASASQKNLFAKQLWDSKRDHDLLLYDEENEDKDQHESSSSEAVTLSDIELGHTQQAQIKVDFTIARMSLLLYNSPSTTNTDDTLLCELVLEHFGLKFVSRPYDMYAHIWLQALSLLDHMEHGREYRYLVTSNEAKPTNSAPTKYLIDVKYKRANPKHPMFEQIFGGYEQSVDVLLSTLTFVVTRDSFLTLYNWILTTFTDGNQSDEDIQQKQQRRPGLSNRSTQQSSRMSLVSKESLQALSVQRGHSPPSTKSPKKTASMKVNVRMIGLQIILNDNGVRLGTVILSSGIVEILLLSSQLTVLGKIGNLVVTDDTLSAIKLDNKDHSSDPNYYLNRVSDGRSNVKIISIDDGELLDFTFATFDPDANDFPGYHQRFYMRLGAFRFLYMDAIKPMLDFLTGFLEMKAVYDSARLAATNASHKLKQQEERGTSLFSFDIVIKSPVLVFPVGTKENNNAIVAHLGQIHAKNEFVETTRPNLSTSHATQVKINRILSGISSISLYSTVYDDSNSTDSPMLDKVDISVSIDHLTQPKQDIVVVGPQTSIRGSISNVMMYLSEDQYAWLLEIQRRLTTTFAGSSDTNDRSQVVDQIPPEEDRTSLDTDNDVASDDIETPATRTQLDLCFDMQLVCLEVFNIAEQDTIKHKQHSLGRLSFENISLKFQRKANGFMVLEMQMRSVNLYDTRHDSNSCFKDMLPAGKELDGSQLQLYLKTGINTHDGESITSIDVTLDRPQVVVSLDYMMHLKDFFALPFMQSPAPTEAQVYAATLRGDYQGEQSLPQAHEGTPRNLSPSNSTKQVRPSARSQGSNNSSSGKNTSHISSPSKLHYRVNVVDLELICLAHPDSPSSEAMVLSFEKLSVSQHDKFVLQLDGIGLILCKMDKRNNSMVPLVDHFNLGMDIQTLVSPGFKNTNMNASIQPITFLISYRNVMLVMDIVDKVTALVGKNGNKAKDGTMDNMNSDGDDGDDGDDDACNSDLEDMLNTTSLLSESGHGLTRQLYTAYRHSGDQKKQQQVQENQINDTHIMVSRESLNARFEGFRLVVVEDLHDLPFLDLLIEPFNVTVSDWSSALVVHARLSTQFNNFNFKTSHWEPLIEPYKFEINVTRTPNAKKLDIGVSSDDTLNMNLTHTFLETIMAVSSTWSATKALPENAQKQIKPFVIENRTGYDMRIWGMLDDNNIDKSSICEMKDGQDQDWDFRDRNSRKETNEVYDNVLGIEILHANWDCIQSIPVDVEGKQSYCLKNDTDDVQYRVVVEVKLKNHVKSVTFYGGLILENQNTSSMQITMMDQSRSMVSPIWTLDPKQVLYTPVGLSYRSWIAVRPSDDYAWCDAPLHWSDMTHPKAPTGISCAAKEKGLPRFMYHLRGVFDVNSLISRQYPLLKVIFDAPIQIINHLPFDFKWTMMDQDSNHCFSSIIKCGFSEPLHTFYSTGNLAFVLDILHEDYGMTELTKILVADSVPKEGVPITVTTKTGNTTNLRMLVGRGKNEKNNLQIEIYSPYIILNKSTRPLSFRFRDTGYSFKSTTTTHSVPACGSKVIPYMFSYPRISPKNRVEISMDGSKWSPALSFEAVGSAMDVSLQADKSSDIHAGVYVEEGRGMYHLTKLVTIAPRFVLKNHSKLKLKIAEYESNESTSLGVDETLPVYTTTNGRLDKWICLQLDHLQGLWSTPIDIQEIGTTFVKIPKGDGERSTLVQASVMMKNATIFITFRNTTHWPYAIVNCSSTDVVFYQESYQNGGRSKNTKTPIQPKKHSLSPEQKYTKYSWDMPAAKDRRLVLDIGGKTRTVDLHAIGTQIPFRYMKNHAGPGSGTLAIDIFSHNSSLVLLLTDFKEENSLFRTKSSGVSIMSSSSSSATSAADHFEPIGIDVIDNYSFNLQLQGVGISVVNRFCQEIIYASIKNLDFKYTDSNLYQSTRVNIQWMQIDNQIFTSSYPILLYPTTLRKDAPPDSDSRPALHLALDKVKDNSHGVTYFKIFSVLLQEMTLELDEDLLYALIEFSQFKCRSNQQTSVTNSDLHDSELKLPTEEHDQSLLFFEQFCIQPMRLNVSFVSTAGGGTTDASKSANSPIGYLLDVLTMTIGNINEAPVKLNALIIENMRASSQDISSRISVHYKDQFVYQIHRVVGSADLLGNPVGLFTNIGSGVGELFYEPYQGFITSERPQDFGIGLARGVGGLLKKSVFGLTDSLSKVTGSLGKGLAMATMDKKFQDRRRMKMTKNKPQHAIFGVTQGVTYLGTSLASGVVGLVKRPMEGAGESGVGGFFGGVGKGLVGVVTKPVVGICDLASNVTVGLRETTTLFDEGALVKDRLPRYIGKDGTLRVYSQREALGQMWMKEMSDGYYNRETYIAHTITDDEKHAAILTWQYLFTINTQKLTVEWFKKLDDLESCQWLELDDSNKGAHLSIKVKDQPSQSKAINFTEPTSGPWFAKEIQKTIEQRNEIQER